MNSNNSIGFTAWPTASRENSADTLHCVQGNNAQYSISDNGGIVDFQDGIQCYHDGGGGQFIDAGDIEFHNMTCTDAVAYITDYFITSSGYNELSITCQEVPEAQTITWPQAEFYMILLVGFIFFFGVVSMFKK